MTFRESFYQIFSNEGFKNFVPKYVRLLDDGDGIEDEKAFFDQFTSAESNNSSEWEVDAKQLSQSLRELIHAFALLVTTAQSSLFEPDVLLLERALHEYMLKRLNFVNQNCRNLMEVAMTDEDDDVEHYLKGLKKKYRPTPNEFEHLSLAWHESDETIHDLLAANEQRLKLFVLEDKQICFQMYDVALNQQLRVAAHLQTSNGLVISKFYFLTKILDIFRHLELFTSVLSKEKLGKDTQEDVEFVEMEEMVIFVEAAEELFNLDAA